MASSSDSIKSISDLLLSYQSFNLTDINNAVIHPTVLNILLVNIKNLKKETLNSGIFYNICGNVNNTKKCSELCIELDKSIELIRNRILQINRLRSADSSNNEIITNGNNINNSNSTNNISLNINVQPSRPSGVIIPSNLNNMEIESTPILTDTSKSLLAVVTPMHRRAVISDAVKNASIAMYNDYIRRVVLPIQGYDIIMLPNPSQRYAIVDRPLKTSIYGQVHIAKRLIDNLQVIVKRSSFEKYDANFARNLENPFRETRLAYMVPPHPNIVDIFEVSYDEISHWVIMEYCGGGEFFDLVSGDALQDEYYRDYFRQMVSAVLHLHEFGVCHLDISLENVLLSSDLRTVKLIDFGQARQIPYTDETRQTPLPFEGSLHHQPAKPYYRAPEIRRGYSFYGHSVDAFALGVILFIMFIKMPPFDVADPNLDGRYKMITDGKLTELLGLWGFTLNPYLVDLITRLLSLPHKRMHIKEIFQHPWML